MLDIGFVQFTCIHRITDLTGNASGLIIKKKKKKKKGSKVKIIASLRIKKKD